MVMSPLQAIGQEVWLISFKPGRHFNAVTYLSCVRIDGQMKVCVSRRDPDTL